MEKGEGKEIKSLEELANTAERFLTALSSRSFVERRAVVVGLSGDLGAGKTAFVKEIAKLLGIQEIVTSPTFILEKIYEIPGNSFFRDNFLKLIHIDAYRLEKGEEMKSLGWEAILSEKTNLVFLEWPEQVESALPKEMITLSFEYKDDKTRNIKGLIF